MRQITWLVLLCLAASLSSQSAQPGADTLAASVSASPSDPKSAKIFAKAAKEYSEGKLPLSLGDFRKADQQAGDTCLACEWKAFTVARQMEDFQTAHEEITLLLNHVSSSDDKAAVHVLAGDLCLAEGGYKIFEKPFQEANKEFEAALSLQPGKPGCLYRDGLALAHLHQYDKARERFEAYMKAASSEDFDYPRARLFAAEPELARRRTAPDFKVSTLDGKTLSMHDLEGKVVLIDFWATWCGPCKQALPHLKEIVEKFQGQPLVVISISLDADEANWKSFVAHNGMTWAQYRDGGFDGPIATSFAVKAIPTTFTIDANGFVQDQQVGDGQIEENLKRLIDKASAGSKTVAQAR